MIDTQIIEDVLKEYPSFNYEIITQGEAIELSITKKGFKKEDYGSRRIIKRIHPNEDLSVLRNVLECKEG